MTLHGVKWGLVYSDYFSLACGVPQGGVLSPCLFAIFIDSVVDRVTKSGLGCYFNMTCFSILLYADDIVAYCSPLLFTRCSSCCVRVRMSFYAWTCD